MAHRLNNADLPTLGRPRMTTVGRRVIWIWVKSRGAARVQNPLTVTSDGSAATAKKVRNFVSW